jgi:hypothetical protein
VATNLAIPTPTLVVEAENEDEPAHAPTTHKFEGDDYIELVIARHPKTSWYWQHGMEIECQKVNAKAARDFISQASNRPQPTHREPSQERPRYR